MLTICPSENGEAIVGAHRLEGNSTSKILLKLVLESASARRYKLVLQSVWSI